MSSLAIDWQGEYAPYDKPEDWLPELEESGLSPTAGRWIYSEG
jgi:hypothetical protein